MSDCWYYRMYGEDLGPVNLARLKELIRCGTLTDFDEIRSEGSDAWVLVSSIDWKGLPAPEAAEGTSEGTDSSAQSGEQGASAETVSESLYGTVDHDDWYCMLDDTEFGPWTFAELTMFAESRQLLAENDVKLGVNGKWRKVGSIGRLMALLPYDENATAASPAVTAEPIEEITELPPIQSLTAERQSESEASQSSKEIAAEQKGSDKTTASAGVPGRKRFIGQSKTDEAQDDEDDDLPMIRNEDKERLTKRMGRGSKSRENDPVEAAKNKILEMRANDPRLKSSEKREQGTPRRDEHDSALINDQGEILPLRSPVSELLNGRPLTSEDIGKSGSKRNDRNPIVSRQAEEVDQEYEEFEQPPTEDDEPIRLQSPISELLNGRPSNSTESGSDKKSGGVKAPSGRQREVWEDDNTDNDPLHSSISELLAGSSTKPPRANAKKKRPSEPEDDEFEQLPEMIPSAEDQTMAEANAVPTQVAYNIAYEQAKAKIAQSMIDQAEAQFRATEEQAKTHIAWASAPTVDRFWYGWASGVEFGPVEFNQVFGLAKSGQLKPTDFVRNGQYSQFAPSSNVPGLYTAVAMIAKATETLNLAKAQAMTVASLAGEAPPAPVDLLTAPLEPVSAPPRRSSAEMDLLKSNPSVGTIARSSDGSDADMTSGGSDGNVEQNSGQSSHPREPRPGTASGAPLSPRSRPASNPEIAARRRMQAGGTSDAEVGARNTSDTKTGQANRSSATAGSMSVTSGSMPASPNGYVRPTTLPPLNPSKKGKSSPPKASIFASFRINDMIEPFKDPKTLGAVCAVAFVLLILGWQFLPKDRRRDKALFKAIKTTFEDIREARIKNPGQLPDLTNKLTKLGQDITTEVKPKANRYDAVKQQLLWTSRDAIPRFVNAGVEKVDSGAERLLELKLYDIAYELGIEKRPPPDPNAKPANGD